MERLSVFRERRWKSFDGENVVTRRRSEGVEPLSAFAETLSSLAERRCERFDDVEPLASPLSAFAETLSAFAETLSAFAGRLTAFAATLSALAGRRWDLLRPPYVHRAGARAIVDTPPPPLYEPRVLAPNRASLLAALAPFALLACSSSSHAPADAGVHDAPVAHDDATDGTVHDASEGKDSTPDVDKSATCAKTFGDALTNAFGRLDGTVLAVVPPADDACALINGTHLVLQVEVSGVAYRMVLDVLSDVGNPDVFFYEEDAPLVAGAWSEGWHAGVTLDYVNTLKLHSTVFTEMKETPLVDKVTSEIEIGSHVSVFATSDGESNSAHLIHRNITGQDGAIVLNPESSSPHYLLFRFAEQTF